MSHKIHSVTEAPSKCNDCRDRHHSEELITEPSQTDCTVEKLGEDVQAEADSCAQLAKNTVRAEGQLSSSEFIKFDGPCGDGIRVLFAGNSITLHGILPEIGWYNEWGMAASAKERDYVHLMQAKIKAIDPNASFCICQVAEWEVNWQVVIEC